ncbi:Molybdopterin-guanine dinucleotide biosynthesis adapter protein, partial [Haemophilus influenzae]
LKIGCTIFTEHDD